MLFLSIIDKIILIFGIFYSIILHEIGHGFAAKINGDYTAKEMNRLSLNPLNHIDLFGTIILPLFLYLMGLPIFGWAKPVPINPLNFYNKRKGMIIVSIAGVFVNFIIMILCFFLYSFFKMDSLLAIAGVNIMLFVFNIIPLPPLDGYNLLINLLPYKFAKIIKSNETTLLIILIILLTTGWIKFIYYPIYKMISIFFIKLFKFY